MGSLSDLEGSELLHPASARPRDRCPRASAHSLRVNISDSLWVGIERCRAVGAVDVETSEGCPGPQK
jgi:hypothetical protein